MQVEVDQSGKVEWTQKATVLALANGVSFSILISAMAKRETLRELESRRPRRSRKMHRILVFATLLFLLLKEHIEELSYIIVDDEYMGYGPTIKEHVLNLFRKHGISVDPNVISTHRIGKKSPAHDLAIKVFKGKVAPDREVGSVEVLAQFGK